MNFERERERFRVVGVTRRVNPDVKPGLRSPRGFCGMICGGRTKKQVLAVMANKGSGRMDSRLRGNDGGRGNDRKGQE